MIYSSPDNNRTKQTQIGNFRSFLPFMPLKAPKVRQTKIFVTLGHFLPFYLPLMILKIKILKKMKKCLEILSFYTYMCTINEDHMIYGSWNIRCNRQKFSTLWAIFCPFSTLTTWKIKILTLKNTPGDVIILNICTTNDNHIIWFLRYGVRQT